VGTVLGLIGLTLFVLGVIGLSAGVTYLVIRLSPTQREKKKTAAEPAA
jgi:hypothetical protein